MMRHLRSDIVLAGILSGLLYAATGRGLLIGILTGFLPIVPIFWAGFRFGAPASLVSLLIASVISAFLLNPASTLLMFLIQGVPALILIHVSQRRVMLPGQGERPYAIGKAMLKIILYEILFFLVLGWLAASQGTSLSELFQQDVKAATGFFDPERQLWMEQVARDVPFLLFAMMGWFWTLLLYLAAWVSHFVTESYWPVHPPSLRLDPFPLPPALPLGILLLLGMGSTGDAEVRLFGYTAALLLLFVYMLYGIALTHAAIGRWKQPLGWYFGFYSMLIFFPWMLFLLTGYGVTHHLSLIFSRK